MSDALQLSREGEGALRIQQPDGRLLWRYVFAPDTATNESTRPYAHPVQTLAGDVVTNFRPNDHPWHHALSLTIASVDGVNFWGGPSHRAVDGYQWRTDHGTQRHLGWTHCTPEHLEHTLEWAEARDGRVLLRETRMLRTTLVAGGWSLHWRSEVKNATDRVLPLENYESLGGLVGSHYTGLQFRGARELLDQHGDATIGITDDAGRTGEATVHGALGSAIEWSCQHDGSLRRTRIRFENLTGPIPWFVRSGYPLAAFPFHRERAVELAVGATLVLDHRITFFTV